MGMLRCAVTLAPPVPPPLITDFPPFFTFSPVLFALDPSLPDLSLFELSLPDLIPLEPPLPALLVLKPSLPDATDSMSLIVDRRGSRYQLLAFSSRSKQRASNANLQN